MSFLKCLNLFESKTNFKIFVDMDGVIVDFIRGWKEIGISDKSFHEYEDIVGKSKIYEQLREKGGVSWWADLKWLPDGKELWNYIKKYNPLILTTPATFQESKDGKKIWCDRELGPDVPLIFSKEKGEYATPNGILIDDYQKKIDNWRNNGGIGILHISTEDTIKQLKKLGL